MFAFGRTVKAVQSACDPTDEQQDVVMAASIISRLTAPLTSERLSASQAVQHDFFAPAKASLKTQTAECFLCLSPACVGGRVNASMGVTCSLNQHFLCAACVGALVEKATQRGGDDCAANLTRLSNGKIHCPHCLALQPRVLCDYADSQFGVVLPVALFDSYLRTRMQLLEDRRMCELEVEMQQKIKQVTKPCQPPCHVIGQHQQQGNPTLLLHKHDYSTQLSSSVHTQHKHGYLMRTFRRLC
jgi:hypothetical protein